MRLCEEFEFVMLALSVLISRIPLFLLTLEPIIVTLFIFEKSALHKISSDKTSSCILVVELKYFIGLSPEPMLSVVIELSHC